MEEGGDIGALYIINVQVVSIDLHFDYYCFLHYYYNYLLFIIMEAVMVMMMTMTPRDARI